MEARCLPRGGNNPDGTFGLMTEHGRLPENGESLRHPPEVFFRATWFNTAEPTTDAGHRRSSLIPSRSAKLVENRASLVGQREIRVHFECLGDDVHGLLELADFVVGEAEVIHDLGVVRTPGGGFFE